MPFVSKSTADRGLPARRGPPPETPLRGTAVPLSGLDLSSPTPTESDLDYAGYDMGDQTDQLEGIIGELVSQCVWKVCLCMRVCEDLDTHALATRQSACLSPYQTYSCPVSTTSFPSSFSTLSSPLCAVSYHIISYRVISYHIITYNIKTYLIISCL